MAGLAVARGGKSASPGVISTPAAAVVTPSTRMIWNQPASVIARSSVTFRVKEGVDEIGGKAQRNSSGATEG